METPNIPIEQPNKPQNEPRGLVPIPERGTPALLEHVWANTCDARLLHFVSDVVMRGDYVAHLAHLALQGEKKESDLTPESLAKTKPGPATRALRRSGQELLEMFLSRAVDSFEIYLVSLIRSVLTKEPRILSDRKQELSLGHILKFDSIEALARDMIEGKLNALSYEGFGELENWCQQRSIPLLVPHGQRDRVVELIALRNIIVHNRGCVDERYRAAVPTSSLEIGEKRALDVEDLFSALDLLSSVVTITDAAVSGKFRLECVEVRNEVNKRGCARWNTEDAQP